MSWSQLVGNSFTQISVINANDIWALDGDGKISRWNGVRWTEIPGQLKRIATGKAGIFGVTPKDILYAWRNDKWEKLPGKANFVEVGASAWVLNNGTPYKFVDEKWVKQPGANFKSLTVGDDGSVWAITNEGAIKSFENDSWVSIEGSFKEISIVNKSFVWAIDESGKLFKRNEATFEEKPNPHNIVSISTSDDYLIGLDATGNVFIFHDVLYLPGWNNLTPKQFKIKNLDVAGRNHAWAITENDEVIYYDEKQNNWEITDSRMVNVSCSGGEVWTIDVDGKVYYRSTDSWVRRNGNLKKLSVGGANVWGISKEGYTFCWNGGNWDKLSGAFSDISVGSDGDVWAVNGAGLVYHWENNFFKLISDAPKLNQISVGRTNNVFGISVENDENILYKWNSSEKTFQKIDNHYHLKYISVHSNSHYWGIDTKGEVYVYSIEEQPIEEKKEVTNFGWISDTNKWSSVSLATSCQIWSLSPEGVPYTTNSADKKLDNPIQLNGKDLKVIAASKDFVWALDKKGGVFQWLSARKLWQQKAGVFKHISNGGSYAVVVNVEGKALRWTGSAWDYLPASPVLKTAAVGRDNQFWAIDEKGTALSLINTKWIEQPFSSPLKYIALGTNDSVWALSQDDKLINFDTKKKEWIEVENPHKFVSISVYSNDHIVGIDANGNLHVTDRPHNVEDFESLTNSDEPNTDMSFWDLIPGKLSSISVGNQDYIYGIASGKIYHYVPTTEGKLPWVQVQGSLVDVSVGNDGSIWGVSKSGRAYQLKGDEWVKHDGEEEIKFKQITCASKDVVWGVDTSGRVFQWNGVQFSLKPPPYMKTIDASPDGTIWGLTLTGNSVYSWTDGDWKQRAQPPGQISLITVEDGDNAWVLSKTGKVSRWNNDESAWQAINGKLSYIASSKHNIWGIDENHLIYKLKKEALSGGANTEELQRISQENEKNKKTILDLEKKLEKLNKHLEKTSLLYEQKLSSFTTDMNRSKEDREKAAEEIKRLHRGMQDYESHLKEAKENSRVLEENNKSLNERLENSKLENEELLKKKEEEERKLRICTWRIVVQTGDLRGAGCDANVSIVLHGDEGVSQEIVLDNDPRNFRRNRKDEFTVRTSEDIGLLQKISIGHDNSGFSPNWYLGWIQILNYRDEKWNFVAASWLDTESGIRKELTPHEGEIVIPKVVVYKLKIFTGDRPGAGTNAKVTCTLHSEDGRFASTLIDSAKFERNQTVEAGIEAIDLGVIKKLQVSHDNTGFAPGWFLDKIIMTNMATGEIKYFLCGKWLATDEDDGHLQRELLPKDTDGVAYLPMNQYTVKVHTGDRRGAGTDANVFITLYGKDSEGNLANSGEKILDTSANNFERAQIDVFGISCISLGSLEYIRIRHDNSGFGPGWFLDKVIVRNETTGGEFFFICGRWLATNEDDRQIVREIPAEGSDRASYDKMVTYKIEVFTGDRRGAGTDANVNICIYGEKGDTGNRPLDSSANDFERNQTDVFGVETVDLGALQKIRIGHDNSGFGPGWFLDTVVITNGKTDEKFFFPCGRWFATNEDDGKLVREIPVHQDNKRAAPLITYHITVYTGDRRGAGTDANVHLIAYGEHGDSGTIQLENSRNNFERGRTDKFEFQSIDLGSLKRIEIGHDNKGIGAGWFLNKVVILSGEGKSWTFGCNNWLAKDEGDGLIRRELAPVGEDFKVLNIANYQITVRTGDRRGAGTDANVFITLYGQNGKSNLTFLDNSQNNFERNKADVFGVECDYLGELTKVVIGHDNKGFGAAWFLDKVEIFSERDNKTYFFLSGRWFATNEDDKQIVREIPASNENGVCTLPLITYKVEVLTGDRRGAGTDANVSITIYGDKGDTGKRVLDGPGNNFERSQTDEFGIEAVELGSLQKIRIGHDDSGIGAAWFLDKVIITNTVTKAQTFFLCGKWLDKSSGDKQIIREIPATNQNGETYAPLTRYKISVYTANRRGAGTDANVFIHLFGDKGESDDLKLDNSLNNFERGQLDIFGFQMVDLGNLKKIRIGHDNKGIGAGWMLDKVVVYCENGAKEWFFPSGQWFDLHEDDGLLIREIDAAEKDINGCPPLTTYNLSIFTGDRRFAGTNAQIHLQLYGEKGNTDVFKIDAKHGSFERGTQFDYSLECGHLGNVTKIRIGHDNKGVGAGWFLDKVIAKDEKEQKTYYFLCGRWLADNEEDEKIEREIASTNQDGKTYAPETRYQITVYTGDRRGAGTDANVYIKLVGEHGDTGLISLDNNQNNFERNKKDVFEYFGVSLGKLKRILIGHDGKGIGSAWFLDKVVVKAEDLALDFFFLSGQWIDSDHGLEKVIEVADKDGQASLPLVYYEVQVFTGDRRGAGTDANVFLTLYGANGDSGERKLDNSQNNFERGKKDMFGFEIVDLGELKKARIRHDNKGLAAGWYLDKIIIKDVKRNVFNYFVCNKWLDTKEDDGLIERELGCSLEDKEIPIPTKQYKIKTITGDVPGAGTDANVFIVITGANGATRETTLDSKGNNFERAQTDEFELSLYDLGELKKIRIGHHSKGPGAGWFLEKVIITPMTGDTEDAPWYFVCQRWLDTNEDDFQTVRELGASLEDKMTSLPWVDYKVSVFTGDRRGAGTSANVSVTIYGESGDSGDRRLDARSGSFERGSVSHFNFEMLDLGKITKLRIGHDNKGIASGWFLDKVVLQAGTGQTYFFLFGRWLDLNEEDGKIVVEGVPAPEDAVTYLPEVTYKVRVKTGDRRGAGTDANVFVELYGDQGKSGEKVLDNKLNNFERNKEDLFGLVCVDVGIPTKIRIRHDNSGIGPGWFLDKIIIHNEKDQKDYYFLCGKWLATDEDDRVIEREIPASNEDGVCTVPLVKYKVIVKTGDRWGAGTDANVAITIYGEKGDTGKRTLDGPGNNFERKKEDVFGVEAVELGEIKKIRIEHDDSGLGAAWFLESVTIEDDKNNKIFFGCGHWLARDEEDGLISRELIATDPSGFSVAPYQNYTVSVTTGDRFGAGTNANISIIVYGANGDSGKRKLETTRGGFERGQTDVFSVECVDLGDLTRLEIGHDNKGIGAGWFLDKVTIKNGRGQQWFFLCGRWLADNEDDKLIKREIKATLQDAKTYQPLIDYKITIKTADRPGAGTDANVFLVITGDQGESAEIKLDNAQNNFERNKVDVFSTQCVCLGNLTKIRLRHDNKGIGAAWLPEKVEILDESIQKVVFFPIVGELWIDKNNLTREFSASDQEGKPLLPLKTYQIVVVTGDRRGAGTDANVFIDVHGEHGNSGRRNLDNSENNFERGKTDTFGFDSVDLGKIIKIQVGHDNKGVGAAWFLDKVIVTDMSNNTNNYFLCGKWLEKDKLLVELAAQTEDGKSCLPEVNYQVKVSTADVRGAGTNAKVSLTIYGESGDTGARILDGQFERNIIDEFTIAAIDLGDLKKIRVGHDNSGFGPGWYLDRISIRSSTTGKEWYFTAGRWLDSKEGDKKIEIELEAKNKDGAPLVPLVTYKITTITGDRRGAGTDANVYIELYGDLGKTGVQKLDGGKDSYERGVTSQFGVDSIDIGTIKKIRIGHDNKGFGPGWLLDKVLVTNLKTGQNYFFLCGKWLATDEGDGLIEREMIASMEDATVLPPLTNYKVLVTTGDKKGAGTNANVSIVIYGDKGDTGIRKLEGKDTFEQGKTDVFGVEAADLGNLTKMRIGHDDKGFRAGWFLDKVQIQNETTGKSWYFLAGRWLDKSEGDKRIQVELPAKDQDGVSYLPETMYTVIISTGDCNSAGTRANVFMTLFGDKGDTGQFKLNNSHLERGTVEEFEHMAVDLGKLSKINIGHDNRGLSSDWFLDKVVIRNETTGIETTFSCQQWLATDKGEKKLVRDIFPAKDGEKVSNVSKYLVEVITGDIFGASTNANVFITIFGTRNNTEKTTLDNEENNFERAKTDRFTVEFPDLGEITKIRIGHDNKRVGLTDPNWYCKSVSITSLRTSDTWFFNIDKWFDTGVGDKLIVREVEPTQNNKN